MAEATITELAAEAAEWFETRGGREFLKEGRPEWVYELVREAHGDFFPDDWRYACTAAALEAIRDADASELDDAGASFADDQVDTYTAGRFEWLSSHLQRAGYVDEAVDELGAPNPDGIVERIALGQYAEALEVFGLVLAELRDRAEELELEEVG